MATNTVEILGVADRLLYAGDNGYKIFSFIPHTEQVTSGVVKLNRYNNIAVAGELPDLIHNKEYIVNAIYKKSGEKEQYIVKNIRSANKDISKREAETFLTSLLPEGLVQNILKEYPNFINLVIQDRINEIDTKKVKGLGEKRLAYVQEKVIENFCLFDLLVKYKAYELSFSQIKKLYENFTSIEVIQEEMIKNPYRCLCSIVGIGFKTADEKILNSNPALIDTRDRLKECIFYLLKENELAGHTWTTIKELFDMSYELAAEAINHFQDVLKKDEEIYLEMETKRVALRKTYECELDIANMLKELMSPDNAKAIPFKTESYKQVDGFDLTEDQCKILDYVAQYRVCILSGYGGTGKTFSSNAVVQMVDAETKDEFKYILLSPTGKASKVLSLASKRDASTIHRGLGFNPYVGFAYNEKNKLPHKFVFVDEATMVDAHLMRSLLKAINPKTTRLVFICDPAQIPSVQAGNCITDIINSGFIPTIFLDKVFRYGEGGLSYVATETRQGKAFLDEKSSRMQVLGVNKDFAFLPATKEDSLVKVRQVYQKLLNGGVDIKNVMVLTSYNKGEFGTYNINRIIQDLVNPNTTDRAELSYIRDRATITFRENDKVIQIKNSYNVAVHNKEDVGFTTCNIFNGDEGIVKRIIKTPYEQTMIVEFDGVEIAYDRSGLDQLLLAYCITIHKSQGSSFTHTIVLAPPAHTYFLNRNLLYVAFTRSRNKLYCVGDAGTIKMALKKSENKSRRTFLEGLLETKKVDMLFEEKIKAARMVG